MMFSGIAGVLGGRFVTAFFMGLSFACTSSGFVLAVAALVAGFFAVVFFAAVFFAVVLAVVVFFTGFFVIFAMIIFSLKFF
jgi:hypothetical protein